MRKLSWRWVAAALALAGLAALAACFWQAIKDDVADRRFEECEANFFPVGVAPATTAQDRGGSLRILGVWPEETQIGNHLCVSIAGVVTIAEETRNRTAAETARDALAKRQADFDQATATVAEVEALAQAVSAVDEAEAKEFRPLPPTDLTVFMNDEVAPFTAKADSLARPQVVRFRLQTSDDAKQTGAKFWRDLLRGTTVDTTIQGRVPVRLGLSRVDDTTTIPDAVAPAPFTLRVFGQVALRWGLAALVLLVLSFGIFALVTTVLRDNKLTARELKKRLDDRKAAATTIINDASAEAADKTKAEAELRIVERYLRFLGTRNDDTPAGSFSLGRSQMAVWFFMVIVAYVFISMTLGQYLNLISPEVLVLLGISGSTGLAAIFASGDKVADRPSKNFVYDILCDADGPQLQRIQTVAWTIVLGSIFAWTAVQEFRLVNFDTNLLLLMGIASGLYIGFKAQET